MSILCSTSYFHYPPPHSITWRLKCSEPGDGLGGFLAKVGGVNGHERDFVFLSVDRVPGEESR
jgi:hypothetical protein